jgi:cellobiose PTS system EIIB component
MRILLCCSAGMSTSLLVSKMKKVAKESNEEYTIWAVSGDSVKHHIDQADVLLLGPQIRFMLPQLKKLGEERGIPVDLINTVHYGTFNGGEVLKQARKLVLQEPKL